MRFMRIAIAALLVLSGSVIAASAQSRVIRFGRLWDGTKIVTDAVVVVDGDRIVSVGSGDAGRADGRGGRRPSQVHRPARA